MSEERLEVIVCSSCVKASPVDSVEGWLRRQLVERPTENGTEYVCPLCNEVVYWVSDSGELEFGV